jgi:hypothetical protein
VRHARISVQANVRLGFAMQKSFFPRCMNNEDIYCNFDENLRPNAQDRLDANFPLIALWNMSSGTTPLITHGIEMMEM